MLEFLKNIWITNGILAGMLTMVIQLIGILAVVVKMFEKK